MRYGTERGALALQRGERRRQRRRRDLAPALADKRGLFELQPDLFQPKCFLCASMMMMIMAEEKEKVSKRGRRRSKKVEEGRRKKPPTSTRRPDGKKNASSFCCLLALSRSFRAMGTEKRMLSPRLSAGTREKSTRRCRSSAAEKDKRACLFFLRPPSKTGSLQAFLFSMTPLALLSFLSLSPSSAHSAGSGACPSIRAVS